MVGIDESADEDATLVRRARDGDRLAFAALVRRHQADAVRLATAITGDRCEAEDATQTAFVKAHAALVRFEVHRPFRPWLLRIVANEAKNRRRATTRRERREGQVSLFRIGPGLSLEEEAIRSLDAAELLRAFRALDHRDRLVLGYRWFAQLTEAEIALALGCATGTAKSRLSRAMKRLRAELEGNARHV